MHEEPTLEEQLARLIAMAEQAGYTAAAEWIRRRLGAWKAEASGQ